MVSVTAIKKSLKASFPDVQCSLETTATKRVVGMVVSKVFEKLDHPDRQRKLWKALSAGFTEVQLQKVGPIAALSPAEAQLHEVGAN